MERRQRTQETIEGPGDGGRARGSQSWALAPPPLLHTRDCLLPHCTPGVHTALFLHVPCCCLKHLKWDQLLQLT